MIVSEPRPMEEVLESLSGVGAVFIVACGGCPGRLQERRTGACRRACTDLWRQNQELRSLGAP